MHSFLAFIAGIQNSEVTVKEITVIYFCSFMENSEQRSAVELLSSKQRRCRRGEVGVVEVQLQKNTVLIQ